MEYNKYKSKCPERLALSSSRYDPYARHQSQSCTRNRHISSRKTCVPLVSPIDPCLPSPPSCMYHKTSTPKDLFLPAITFTPSLAASLLEEETLYQDKLVSSPSYDLESLATLSEDYYDAFMPSSVVPYDLENISAVSDVDIFSNITEEFLSYLVDPTPLVSREINLLQDELPLQPSSDPHHSSVSNSPHSTIKTPGPKHIFHDENPYKSTNASKYTTKIVQPTSQKADSDSRLQCDYCPKKFHFRTSWKVHMRTHTGEKPYTCKICSRSFSDNSTYVKHLRTHTKEKPYSCDVCNKSFSQSGNLTRHKKIHKS